MIAATVTYNRKYIFSTFQMNVLLSKTLISCSSKYLKMTFALERTQVAVKKKACECNRKHQKYRLMEIKRTCRRDWCPGILPNLSISYSNCKWRHKYAQIASVDCGKFNLLMNNHYSITQIRWQCLLSFYCHYTSHLRQPVRLQHQSYQRAYCPAWVSGCVLLCKHICT
jgi:hypothetical protein